MPRRNDIQKILVIGSGPIVIGQSAEFDYSGTQACKALRQEGYEVVLVNSNPATIMTDPELADRTYIEPLTRDYVEEIIRVEAEMLASQRNPGKFALLPTVGGQTALNLAVDLADAGILDRYNVELIGAKLEAIKKAEDRLLFKDAMIRIGLEVSKSALINNLRDGLDFAAKLGFPVLIRPSFTLGGSGGGIAYNREELMEILARGLDLSPVHECLLEESVLGWKEYELEVMRDLADNVIIICSIENFDPMGVHTGDSITVAPAQTLTDREYQKMRDAAIAVMREIGVETGGSNVQFAVNPANGRMTVIEMNPRVSRSSALASKATGFPIAKIAAKLAVGYTLDEIPNDITRKTPACFEPTIDYVVVKIPKWQFEKFPGADDTLGPQMKSVGEVMAMGRTFKEALMKAWRALETGKKTGAEILEPRRLTQMLVTPRPERLGYIRFAFERGMSVREVARLTGMDPWFLHQIREVTLAQQSIAQTTPAEIETEHLRQLKRFGLSDERIATEWKLEGNEGVKQVRELRESKGIKPVFKLVDTCAAEFESMTPYLYSTYDEEDEAPPTDKPKIIILGSGPNRIGQGIEFDYCCCHAAFALKEDGYETIMVNCNPETVSTDYDTSDRLYFEPLVLEDVLAVYNHEAQSGAQIGMIVQYGGQTPLNLAQRLRAAGVPIIGTSPESIDLAEDRKQFGKLLDDLQIPQPAGGTATSVDEALAVAERIGYPVLVRPSYVLGGRAMVIAYDAEAVARYMREAVEYSQERPVLVDHFLESAIEVDVDALCDSKDVIIAGIMQHIEEAGIHSGDSSCVLPPVGIREETLQGAAQLHPQARAGAQGHRPGQSSVCHSAQRRRRRSRLRDRSQSARLAHRSLRFEGNRHSPGQSGRTADDGPDAARTAARTVGQRQGPRSWNSLLCQVARLSLEQVRRRRHGSGAGDEIHRRGHGCGSHVWRGLRQGATCRRAGAAHRRHGLLQRQRPRQACGDRTGQALCRSRFQDRGYGRYGRSAGSRARVRHRYCVQGERRPAQRRRSHQGRPHSARHQYPARPGHDLRREGDSPRSGHWRVCPPLPRSRRLRPRWKESLRLSGARSRCMHCSICTRRRTPDRPRSIDPNLAG